MALESNMLYNNYMKRALILITLLLTTNIIAGCRWVTEAKLPPLMFGREIQVEGTPKFKLGFSDGCRTVLHARGYGFYRAKYKWEFNPDLIDDSEYMFGRVRGYNYCFGYVIGGSGHFSGGWDKYILGNASGTPFNMGKGNIDNTVKYGNVFDVLNVPGGGVSGSVDVLSGGGGGGVLSAHPFWGKRSQESGKIIGW
ncbi:MAG: hypothetical protein O3B09_00540 [Proteobacteria bacterium]|nr:hypothetical protein [Pseudomonadota bacterium]